MDMSQKMFYIYIEDISAIKEAEIVTFAEMWVDLGCVQNEVD